MTSLVAEVSYLCVSWFWCHVELTTPKGKVIIVDDDSSLRRVLRVTLAAHGFKAEEASTGEEALVRLRADRYDVVLLDVEMPGMGGIETCKEIKRLSSQPVVLMLTVRDSQEDRAKSFAAGADDYLTKPFRLPDLLARVRTALVDPPSISGCGGLGHNPVPE